MPLDKSAFTLTWEEDGLRPHPEHRFRTQFESGTQKGYGSWGSRNLAPGHEAQVYVDPLWAGQCSEAPGWKPPALGLNPFTAGDGEVRIMADRLPPALGPTTKAAEGLPSIIQYTSGVLTTAGIFEQLYGYFETDLMASAGRGLWPAFWMLPKDNTWPPEIDGYEGLMHDPSTGYCTSHWVGADGKPAQAAHPVKMTADITAGFVTFGVEWLPSGIRYFINGEVVAQDGPEASPSKPMHLIWNLAVGGPGSWPGPPDATTQFPAFMAFRARAYRIPTA